MNGLVSLSAWLVACVLAEGFFAGTEMALLSANRSNLATRAEQGEAGARRALAFLERQDRLLATCLIGTNLALVTGATIAVSAGMTLSGSGWLLAALYVPVALVFGEAVPKMVYAAHADTLAPVLVFPLRAAELAFTPLLGIVSTWSTVLQRVTPAQRPLDRADFVQMVSDRHAGIDPKDRRFIQRAIGLAEICVEQSMTPLVDLVALPETATVAEAIRVVHAEGWSRVPVFRERVDALVGVLDHRDLLFAEEDARIRAFVRPVRYVPESKKVDELLRELRAHDEHLAVVVDEYGGSVGIVTLTDLLAPLLGDIRDERDEQTAGIQRLGEREWRVPARATIDEVSAAIGRRLPEGDYETIAGLLLQLTGTIPKTGDAIRVGRCTVTVEDATERAVTCVRLQFSDG